MSRLHLIRKLLAPACIVGALLFSAAGARAQQYQQPAGSNSSYDEDTAQTPGRVARLAYLSGQVQFAPAGEDDWGSVEINRPMVIGDRLLTGDDGRATLELGDASVRIDHDSAFDFLNLDENNVQIELSQGTLNVAVRSLADGENIEVDTPTVAFVASTPGVYRIDDSPTGTGTMVTVFRGSGVVYGENGVSREVAEGTSYRFNDSALTSVDANSVPEPDDFDRFCETRDADYERYASEQRQYVPPEMIGGDDLYQYGQWNSVPEYGNVWYPTSVPVGWAPYRYGHWAWIDPWGWTWVDDQPWGFAPFHYGRWVYVSNRWGWVPGPVNVRPVYAPALVAFLGGSGVSLSIRMGGGGPVGWFPLGPRDVYVPWFHASRRYFTSVNVTNIRNVYVNRTVINNFYNDYSHQRYADIHQRNHYRYRNLPGAVTVVPRATFTGARPVHPAVLKLGRTQLAHAQVAVRPDVTPGKASLGLRRPAARPAVLHGRQPFTRPVVARHAPPPRPVGFAARQKVIASQHGQPLSAEQMRTLRRTRPASEGNERVKLVAAHGQQAARATANAARPGQIPQPGVAGHGRPVKAPRPSNAAHPVAAGNPPVHPSPLRPGELPSARFRHPERAAPRPQALRSAGQPQQAPPAGRLPVVRPIQAAPQASGKPIVRSPRPADLNARPRAQPPQQQQQRQQQEIRTQQDRQRNAAAAQQRAHQQQMEQQRAAQAQMRQREQQAQQQARAQNEQRAREQQVQRERQMQQIRAQQAQQVRAQQAQELQREAHQRAVQQRPPPRYTPPRGGQRPPPPQSDRQDHLKKHPDSSGHK